MLTDEEYYRDAIYYSGARSPRSQAVDYIDIAPKPFVPAIPLVEYFERVKRYKADRWQRDFCRRLEEACVNRHTKPTWSLIHAESQLGKSSILAQCYPAWILGHDPLHQIALATYNVTKSQDHSRAVIGIMNLPIHRDIFPNKEGWISDKISKEKWSTPAKAALNDAQFSFNPVGLQSGLVGSGFGTLLIDDPYAAAKEAFSEQVRKNLCSFWDDTAQPRINNYTNVFGMFHRYHCLLPYVKIETPMGSKTISEIKQGNKVLTSRGSQIVEAVQSRKHVGDIYKLRVIGYPFPVEVTPDHRLLTQADWKEAKDIRTGEYMKFPIPQGTTPDEFLLSLWPEPLKPKVAFPSRNTGEKNKIDRAKFTRMYKGGMSCQKIADELGYKSGQAMQRYVTLWGLNRTHAHKFNANPALDPEFWRLVGYWLADGWVTGPKTSKEYLGIAFNSTTKQSTIKDAARILKKYNIPTSKYSTNGSKCIKLHFSARQFVQFVSQFGRGSHNKFLPEWAVRLPELLARELIRGYLAGDGCISKEGGQAKWARFSSCSMDLLEGFRRLCLKYNIIASIMPCKETQYELRFPACQAPWLLDVLDIKERFGVTNISVLPTKTRFAYIEGEWLYVRVKSIEIDEYDGLVYDIQTPCHDFIACGMTVHNCEDLAGYLLNAGNFDYWRYATVCDGDYIHDETGQKFPDPLARKEGEYISERRGPNYRAYQESRKSPRVWNSQFQGRPSAQEGDFFHVGKISFLETPAAVEEARRRCVAFVRAWDHAATEDSGDYSAGALVGIQPDGQVVLFDMRLQQLDTAGRIEFQKQTAVMDGYDVPICVPKELASAGKDVVFFTQEYLKGFTVNARSVITSNTSVGSTAKARRAHNFSIAVNSGQVSFVRDQWNADVLRSMRNFLFSDFDDPIDAMADAYNFLFESLHQGLVFHNYQPQRNLITGAAFQAKLPYRNQQGEPELKIPAEFTIYAGLKINAEQSRPTSGVIAARASELSGIRDSIIVLAEYKAYDGDIYKLIEWLDEQLQSFCIQPYKEQAVIWLHPDSEQFEVVIAQKLKTSVAVFDGDSKAGLTELDWHLLPTASEHPFNTNNQAAGMYLLVTDNQLSVPTDAQGFIHARQEFATWGFNDKGEPSAVGGVLDCLRMITTKFATHSVSLTADQKFDQALLAMMPEPLKGKTAMEIARMETVPGQMAPMLTMQMNEMLLKQRRREEQKYIPGEEMPEDSMANGW